MGQPRWIDTGRVPGETGRAMEPELALQEAMRALKDSAEGLARAAELVDDEGTAGALRGMADSRRAALGAVMDEEAVGAGVRIGDEVGGSVGGALRRGWMRLEAGVADDDAVVGTVIDEEEHVVDHLSRAIDRGLPGDLGEVLRTTSLEVQDGIRRLREGD